MPPYSPSRRVTHNAAGEPIWCTNQRIPADLVESGLLRDLSDDEYQAERLAIESDLARLPASSTDMLLAFDEARARLLSMPEAIAAASPRKRAEIVPLLVARVVADREHGLVGLGWTPPAARYFRRVLSERAVWDSNPRHED